MQNVLPRSGARAYTVSDDASVDQRYDRDFFLRGVGQKGWQYGFRLEVTNVVRTTFRPTSASLLKYKLQPPQYVHPFLLGVIHNCHHFHERTQRTLGGGGQGRPYAFLNVVFKSRFLNVVMEITAHVRRTSRTKN